MADLSGQQVGAAQCDVSSEDRSPGAGGQAKVHQAAVDAARCSGFLQGGEADVVVDDDGSPELLAEDFADPCPDQVEGLGRDRKSTRLNSSHVAISYAVFCLQKKKR